MDAYWAAPPVMRTITLLTVVTSALAYAGVIAPYNIVFYPPVMFTLKKFPQIWRLVTSFWLTGPKLGMLFDPYFLFTYGSLLETDSPRFGRRGNFMAYIIFVECLIVIICGGFLGGYTFVQPLLLALAYTYSQDNTTQKSRFFVITIQTKFLPYLMLGLTFIMGGPTQAYQQATGLLAAHAYDFLTRIWPTFGGGRNWIEWATPMALQRAFGEGTSGRTATARGYGVSYSGNSQTQSQSSQGQSSGWSNSLSSWGQRGSGRRLGGD